MKKIEQLINLANENDNKLNFYQIKTSNLNNDELDDLLNKMEKSKINIEPNSIYQIIKLKEKKLINDQELLVNSVDQYFKEINRLAFLDVCEEKLLFYFYRHNKSYEVRNFIVAFYLKLVSSIGMEYVSKIKNTSYQFLDIIQDGNDGLIRAVEKYDVMIGIRFSIYATWWIKRYIDLGLIEKGRTIRIPPRILEDYNKIMRFKNEVQKKLTNREIAEAIGLTETRVEYVLSIMNKTVVSLDEYIDESKKNTKFETIMIEEATLEESIIEKGEYQLIKEIMGSVLTEKEFFVVSCKNGFINKSNKIPGEKTLDEVGKILGVTRERIRQILKTAYEKIKNAYEIELTSEKNKKISKK